MEERDGSAMDNPCGLSTCLCPVGEEADRPGSKEAAEHGAGSAAPLGDGQGRQLRPHGHSAEETAGVQRSPQAQGGHRHPSPFPGQQPHVRGPASIGDIRWYA